MTNEEYQKLLELSSLSFRQLGDSIPEFSSICLTMLKNNTSHENEGVILRLMEAVPNFSSAYSSWLDATQVETNSFRKEARDLLERKNNEAITLIGGLRSEDPAIAAQNLVQVMEAKKELEEGVKNVEQLTNFINHGLLVPGLTAPVAMNAAMQNLLGASELSQRLFRIAKAFGKDFISQIEGLILHNTVNQALDETYRRKQKILEGAANASGTYAKLLALVDTQNATSKDLDESWKHLVNCVHVVLQQLSK